MKPQTIIKNGPISISNFMQLCLTHPKYGYYTTRDPLGVAGDFTTSPEISQMFGELIGINILTQWLQNGKPRNVRIAELGPGRGTLMSDLLRTLKTFKQFYNQIDHIALVEQSPTLKAKQKALIENHGIKTDWFDFAKELPADGTCTYLIAHEFFDALPIKQFIKLENQLWAERKIDFQNDKFQFVVDVKNPSVVMSAVLNADERYKRLPVNSEIEISPASLEVAQDISKMLLKNTGTALVIDYGPKSTIPVNTFRGFKNHHQVNPLEVEPGSADLTADVDFKGLASVFEKNKLKVLGPTSQRDWLHKMGIGARATVLAQNGDQKRVEQAYNRLTDAGGMGKTYKFMCAGTYNSVEGFDGVENK